MTIRRQSFTIRRQYFKIWYQNFTIYCKDFTIWWKLFDINTKADDSTSLCFDGITHEFTTKLHDLMCIFRTLSKNSQFDVIVYDMTSKETIKTQIFISRHDQLMMWRQNFTIWCQNFGLVDQSRRFDVLIDVLTSLFMNLSQNFMIWCFYL